ncbi:hypothetical protein QYH69_35165 [Paraburkholderia sp. SARCC-3016]|uniref:DUF6602 domain-containing protein n=1 Tax=Paraburkholderia sp. SARCC-3016 TaxID=3058611 RepID=UPI002809CEB4|nr:DUF6602 domain-containing protein [Paraburkholderia sp. SARCC-3016]MDQ7982454.1 hypothetical protein [Paraburkholderia sp. SARCC-3016]
MAQSSVDVRQLLSATAASLWATFQESAASARHDHKGHPREARLRQFLRERLPPKWGVSRGHVFYAEDATTPEFDVIVYDALNCPAWTLDSHEDPRRLVPLDAVIGVIEVKSTLDRRSLASAIAKARALDDALAHDAALNGPGHYQPFRHVFAYRLDRTCDFDGWLSPARSLTRYAGARCQPDGIFVLDSHFSVLEASHGYAHAFALHRGQTPDEVARTSSVLEQEDERRLVQEGDAWGHDYFTTDAIDGLLLLAFLTYVIQRASHYRPAGINYADMFCRRGGPKLGGIMDFYGPPDPGFAPVTLPGA